MIVYLEVVEGEYDAAIQFQCQEDETGIVFTGLNFLTKSQVVSQARISLLLTGSEFG